MSILAFLLGRLDLKAGKPAAAQPLYRLDPRADHCPNSSCITNTEVRHSDRAFRLISRVPMRVACGYCDQELEIGVVGCSTTESFHPKESQAVRKIRADHLLFFRDAEQALSAGFSSSVGV